MMPVLYAGRDYLVRYNRANDERLVVVVFEPWSHAPTLDGAFFGEAFFASRCINAIGVKTASNDWFQSEEMPDVIAAILNATPGVKRVGYGGSMGAFACINFADDLDLRTVIALGPQYSVDPEKVPFDTRWRDEAAKITFRHDKIDRIRPIANGYLLFDPTTVDARHAGIILKRHGLTPLKLYFSGHQPLTLLLQTHLLDSTLLGMIHRRFDRRSFTLALRRRRRQSAWLWHNVSTTLKVRGGLVAALAAARTAKQCNADDPFPIDANLAELLVLSGHFEEGSALLAAYVDHPDHGAFARWQTVDWRQRFAGRDAVR